MSEKYIVKKFSSTAPIEYWTNAVPPWSDNINIAFGFPSQQDAQIFVNNLRKTECGCKTFKVFKVDI